MDNTIDIIQHHGVKGMRWGHRKLNSMIENHKENLRYKYRKKGLNEQQVESKLQRRLKTERTLAKAAPILTVQTLAKPTAALAAVTAYKQHKKNTQKRQSDKKYNEKYNRRD